MAVVGRRGRGKPGSKSKVGTTNKAGIIRGSGGQRAAGSTAPSAAKPATKFKQKIGKPITTGPVPAPSRDGVMTPNAASTSTSTPAASTSSKGPSWKPAKSSVTGNYGKAVSAAAKAKPKGKSK